MTNVANRVCPLSDTRCGGMTDFEARCYRQAEACADGRSRQKVCDGYSGTSIGRTLM